MNKIYIFLTGIIAALGALFFELALGTACLDCEKIITQISLRQILFLLIAVLIEELFKFLLIRWNTIHLSSKKEIISASLLCGAGFSFAEISFLHLDEILFQTESFLPLLGIAAIHLATAGIMGFSLARFGKKAGFAALLTFFIASTLHFAYNLALVY